MKRYIIQSLRRWRASSPHKPIIMRGARQVGKTTLARQFGAEFENFVEINLEKDPDLGPIFDGNLDPKRLVRLISAHTGQSILPGKTLLFIDEIQEAPRAIIALRYFYEEMPQLHVIAAGSLLEFALEEVGVPVGRINFLYVYPLSFTEFLLAINRGHLIEFLLNHDLSTSMESIIHAQLLEHLSEYFAIGGMPEAVKTWCEKQELHECQLVHHSIIETYKQDFSKYAKAHQIKYLDVLFIEIARQAAKHFSYSKVPGNFRKRELAPALELLIKAGLVKPVYHSSGQGIPIEAQADYGVFKCLFVDIALAQTILGYDLRDWFFHAQESFINKGEITESYIGQELLAYANPFFEKKLYYWTRQTRSAMAEVDYIIEHNNQVVPIEVKSGASTKLKSLYSFLNSHENTEYGIRLWPMNFQMEESVHSFPLYAIASLMIGAEHNKDYAVG